MALTDISDSEPWDGPLTPFDQYLTTSYHPDREYIDGHTEERNLGTYDHARLLGVLAVRLLNQQREWNIRVLISLRMHLSPTRVRVPNITLLDRSQPIEQIVTHPPLIVIEILSPEDTWPRDEDRIADYLKFGVPSVWILDPATRRAWAISSDGRRSLATTLAVAGTPITVSLDELCAEAE